MFLATTALSDFWDKRQKILFLGKWCLRYDKKEEWESLNYEVLPYPWDDRKKVHQAYNYCNDLSEKLLRQLVPILNQQHGERFDSRAWRIILGVWFNSFVSITYHHYVCLKEALNRFPSLETWGMDSTSFIPIPDTLRYFIYYREDYHNLQLFTQILKEMGMDFLSKIPDASAFLFKNKFASQVQYNLNQNSRNWKTSIKNQLIILLKQIIKEIDWRLGKNRPIILCRTHFPLKEELRLSINSRFKLWPFLFFNEFHDYSHQIDRQRRACFKNLSFSNEFEKILVKIFPQEFPVIFLEGYCSLKKFIKENFPMKPKAIVSATQWLTNEPFKLWAAMATMNGAKLVGIQHGGGYGMRQCLPIGEKQEMTNLDRFYSWGWTRHTISTNVEVVPAPASKLVSIPEFEKRERRIHQILYVATTSWRYPDMFISHPTGPSMLQYLEWQKQFFQLLPEEIFEKMLVRLHPRDWGWCNLNRLRDLFLTLKFDNHKLSFQKQLEKSNLVIVDNLNTTLFEAIASNVPTLSYWDPKLWEVNEVADSYFDELRRVGMHHDSPESVVNQIKVIMHDPWKWWHSPEVQTVIQLFINTYARRDKNWREVWLNELLHLI